MKIIKITSYEEDLKKAENLTDKLEENISRRNISSISENSISFEINFEKWCQKTFNKNLEEYKADTENDKEKEKELLKNGNIDQLYDYITNSNSKNDKKISEKEKNKRKKKNKNKVASAALTSKDITNRNNNSDVYKNKINDIKAFSKANANCDVDKEHSCFLEKSSFTNKNLVDKKANYDFSKICDAEVELFRQNIIKDNKKASDIMKIKPIFSTNWLQSLN